MKKFLSLLGIIGLSTASIIPLTAFTQTSISMETSEEIVESQKDLKLSNFSTSNFVNNVGLDVDVTFQQISAVGWFNGRPTSNARFILYINVENVFHMTTNTLIQQYKGISLSGIWKAVRNAYDSSLDEGYAQIRKEFDESSWKKWTSNGTIIYWEDFFDHAKENTVWKRMTFQDWNEGSGSYYNQAYIDVKAEWNVGQNGLGTNIQLTFDSHVFARVGGAIWKAYTMMQGKLTRIELEAR